jgi:outer membrane biosynthesis protein TonB
LNLLDDPHTCTNDSTVCAHCGQVLPAYAAPEYGARYGEKRTNRAGLAFTIGLHLLLVALYVFQPYKPKEKPAAAREGQVVYVAPLSTPKPTKPTPSSPRTPRKNAAAPPERARVERLPNTISVPDEPPAPVAKTEPKPEPQPAPQPRTEIEPGMDMADYIAKRRAQRGAPTEQPAEETEAQRGTRNALANVAALNGRSREDGKGKATLEITSRTFHSAVVDFSGFNPNFKRKWLNTITVEQGNAPDVETAVINAMILAIRRGMTVDFMFERRNGKMVQLSTRPEDEEVLRDFLFKEFYPEYKRALR